VRHEIQVPDCPALQGVSLRSIVGSRRIRGSSLYPELCPLVAISASHRATTSRALSPTDTHRGRRALGHDLDHVFGTCSLPATGISPLETRDVLSWAESSHVDREYFLPPAPLTI
jgi:hypothetical protein